MIRLGKFFRSEAPRAMGLMSSRLAARKGVGGRRLRGKKRSDGRRLGGSIVGLLRRGRVSIRSDGFAISYRAHRKIENFHLGSSSHLQPPRPIVGLSSNDEAEIRARLLKETVRQLNRGVR